MVRRSASAGDAPPFAEALAALEKPLRFACGGGPERLARIKDLEATLQRAARRARDVAPTEPQRRSLEAIAAGLPSPLAEPETRLQVLRRCLQQLESLRREGAHATEPPPAQLEATIAGSEGADAARPEPPAASATRKRRRGGDGAGIAERKGALAAPSVSPAGLRLDAPVQFLKGVGPRIAELLATRGIATVEDLLRFLPRRYEDRHAHRSIGTLSPGERVSVEGEVLVKSYRAFGRRRSLDVVIGDDSGRLALKWFRVPGKGYAERFVKGRRLRVSGQVKLYRGSLQMTHPETALVADGGSGPVEDAVVPVYLEVEGVRPAQLRAIIRRALPASRQLVDVLPEALRARHRLPTLAESIAQLHQPPPDTPLETLFRLATPWHHRLIYEELLLLQLAVLRRKAEAAGEPGHAVELGASLRETAAELFSFALTAAQGRVLDALQRDLQQSVPMHRLLQGDVGSGKTAVAMTCAAAVARTGLQVALVAPTEILAEQHARVALKTLTGAGLRVVLLTGNLTAPERRRALAQIADGRAEVVVGTHAVLQQGVQFARLGLGIVDEQHRFGVMQRARLVQQGREGLGCAPHMLIMTATPIPRTLALTAYGDLDLSVIDELPPGRMPIRTELHRGTGRAAVYRRVREAVQAGRQAYVVFPLVEESDKEGMERLHDATSAAEELANGPLAGLRVALLHGRMPADDKDRIMRAFARGEVQVLVATTVIEVGIDVPNATVMVIEHAERFGLSQLHQLRGRVGRGSYASTCYLVAYATQSEDAWHRLKVMERSNDGFVIAEEDLALRGPGDFVGTRQSGLPMLSMADLARDQKLLVAAREDAAALLAEDPQLASPENAALRQLFERVWQARLELAQIG